MNGIDELQRYKTYRKRKTTITLTDTSALPSVRCEIVYRKLDAATGLELRESLQQQVHVERGRVVKVVVVLVGFMRLGK
jgi:hypothetical protein